MSINTQKIKQLDFEKSFKFSKLKTEDFSHRAETREEKKEKKEKEFEEDKRTRTREKKSKKMTTTVS